MVLVQGYVDVHVDVCVHVDISSGVKPALPRCQVLEDGLSFGLMLASPHCYDIILVQGYVDVHGDISSGVKLASPTLPTLKSGRDPTISSSLLKFMLTMASTGPFQPSLTTIPAGVALFRFAIQDLSSIPSWSLLSPWEVDFLDMMTTTTTIKNE